MGCYGSKLWTHLMAPILATNLRHVLADSISMDQPNPTFVYRIVVPHLRCTWSMLRKSCIMSASQTCERCWSPPMAWPCYAILGIPMDSISIPCWERFLYCYPMFSYAFKTTKQPTSASALQAWQQLLAAPPRYLAPGAWTPSSPRCRTDPCRRKQTASDTQQKHRDGSKPWYLVNPKIAGKWMFIPLKMVLIGIDP